MSANLSTCLQRQSNAQIKKHKSKHKLIGYQNEPISLNLDLKNKIPHKSTKCRLVDGWLKKEHRLHSQLLSIRSLFFVAMNGKKKSRKKSDEQKIETNNNNNRTEIESHLEIYWIWSVRSVQTITFQALSITFMIFIDSR